jgi:hypothetical protein
VDENGLIKNVERGQQPTMELFSMIHSRLENPDQFLYLSWPSLLFEIQDELTIKDNARAMATTQILGLNIRDVLIRARRNMANDLYRLMKELVEILNADSQAEVSALVAPIEENFDWTLPLAVLKDQITIARKLFIQSLPHPSVWQSIKQFGPIHSPKWKSIFDQFPEALEW